MGYRYQGAARWLRTRDNYDVSRLYLGTCGQDPRWEYSSPEFQLQGLQLKAKQLAGNVLVIGDAVLTITPYKFGLQFPTKRHIHHSYEACVQWGRCLRFHRHTEFGMNPPSPACEIRKLRAANWCSSLPGSRIIRSHGGSELLRCQVSLWRTMGESHGYKFGTFGKEAVPRTDDGAVIISVQ